MDKLNCMACRGIGKKGMYKAYMLPCAYCNGSGEAKDRADNISIGLRAGILNRHAMQMELEFTQIEEESCLQLCQK
jgi:DnaJ-class molecular chaperone